jgi:hypothetical protein
MKKLKNKIIFFSLIFFILFFAFSADAQGIVPCGSGNNISNACTLCHFIVGIKNIVDFGSKILVITAITAIFISGIMYIISSGSQEMTTRAKSFLTSSLIGFFIVLAAWLIVNTVFIVLAAKPDLDIGKTNWYTFTCDTQTSTGAAGTTTPAKTSPENIPQAAGASCSALPNQVRNQCGDASSELNTLIGCVSGKLSNKVQITSISDGNGGINCYQNNPTWKQCTSDGGKNCCFHAKNSCHYGGNCGGSSYGVDLKPYGGSTSSDIQNAVSACGGRVNPEGTHIHASVQTNCCNL